MQTYGRPIAEVGLRERGATVVLSIIRVSPAPTTPTGGPPHPTTAQRRCAGPARGAGCALKRHAGPPAQRACGRSVDPR